ncbi:HNH endonuclease [Streptomyces sp. AV19]|uniref:HNH endonuclease family protein n=1 Tax=Streptomyces sp. AV19 TaxID=2793068 RepID=UPI0018FE898B|nr:HNH endonuclease family protein [Streptomyces sp. AV19]MBH1937353.1 HNH endonuclease [Streptomyces sp. AV19]MDG4533917.1 HNH endonuclease family protein [Streptomyces sp. AV19]
MKSRTPGAVCTAVLLAVVVTGCSGSKDDKAEGKAANGTARAALDTLSVKQPAAKSGYDREGKFGRAWSDKTDAPGSGNRCDTRNDILARDLKSPRNDGSSSCVVASGTLDDPYTGKKIKFQRGTGTSSAVQIDHVVALGQAWVSGAQKISQRQREALANDPLNLIAADGPANGQKSDKDASKWLPGNTAYQCTYVARQIAVKKKYGLAVHQGEKDAMARVLKTCPNEKLPGDGGTGVALKETKR